MALEGVVQRALAAICVLAVAGCGGDSPEAPEPSHPIKGVVDRLQASFATRNLAAICKLMTRPSQVEAGNIAHSSPTTCSRDVGKVFRMIDRGGGWIDSDPPRVVSIDERGDSATAVLSIDGWRGAIPFARVDGEWKIASFIGMGADRLAAVERQGDSDVSPEGKLVRVAGEISDACPPMLDDDYPNVSGGCEMHVSDNGPVPVEMLTPYGAFKFGDCYVDYRMLVDDAGRTWTDEWEVEGNSESGCSDINPCVRTRRNGRIDKLPWPGRIVAAPDGALMHHTRMCVRTCIGMFAGDLAVRLVQEDGRWRVEPTDEGVTGFKLDAPLDVYGLPFEIAPALG